MHESLLVFFAKNKENWTLCLNPKTRKIGLVPFLSPRS